MAKKVRKVSFPQMGNYQVPIRYLSHLFGDEVIMPPPLTKRSLELGVKHSPESVCVPFKYILGNFIEVLEKGANVLVQIGGGCRAGFYGEVQMQILRDMGYEFEFIKLTNSANLLAVAADVKRKSPQQSWINIGRAFWLGLEMAKAVDVIEGFTRKNIGFEVEKGSFESLFKKFNKELDGADSVKKVRQVRRKYETQMREIEVDKPKDPIRVGVVGEIYVVMEPFSNFFLERELAKFGIEVHRFMEISEVIRHSMRYKKHIHHLIDEAGDYIQYAIGGHGTESVALANKLAISGFDGLIHVKPFGCMPEVNAMSVLHNISRDYKFPIVYFSFDSLTSETGVKTRLEAFHDMLVMKRKERRDGGN